jgi:pilus assembly protein CpaB
MNRRVVLVVIAVVLAVTGTGAVYLYVKHADNRALAKIRAADVLIVQRQIPAGTAWIDVGKDGYVKHERVPVTATPSNAVTSIKTGIPGDEVASAVIQPGQVIVREMFSSQASVTGVLAIPKGMIALSVSLNSNADVAGYVQPQSEVAIFSTFKLDNTGTDKANNGVGGDLYTTKLLLSKVRVIATSSAAPADAAPRSGNGSGTGGSVLVTLAVSQQDAQRLILAQQVGQLYLGLRTSDSQTSTDDRGVVNVGQIAPAPIFVK